MSDAPENILIIKPSSLGDVVLALPAFTALRRSFPDARISWLIRPEFAPLLENHPDSAEIILFDRKFLGKAWYNPCAFGSLISLIRRLRRSRFDTVIDLQGLFRTASLAWLSGCKKRFGMANARELSHIFYTHKIALDSDHIHLVDYYMKVVQAAGVSNMAVQFVLPENPDAADSIKGLLATNGIERNNYAVFIPGSAHSDKWWPIERFAVLADRIRSRFGLSIIATGTKSEKGLIEQLKSLAKVPITNFAALTNLSELIELLKTATLVVSNDTGPGHIAAASGVPLVLIFGRSNPVRLAPYKRSNCVVAIEPNERGLKFNSTNPKYNVKNITIEQVYQKVCEQIENIADVK